ncbi:MAG TPA: hypothetical protein VM557_12020 [Thermoanaerobaculia bacterium]|nr:hypothetical protein [Thermoanaerobaculia bacterium]
MSRIQGSLLLFAFLGGCATLPAPERDGYLEVVEGVSRITCHGSSLDGPFGSRLARSMMLMAPGGERGAWVETEARALIDAGREGTCQNVSTLWVREGASAPFVAFTQQPGWEGTNGNSLRLIDWSEDGKQLLLELQTWTYPTDPVDPILLIYDASTRQVSQLPIAASLQAKYGSDCRARLEGTGFSDAGEVLITVAPFADDSKPSCLPTAQTLAWSPREESDGEFLPAQRPRTRSQVVAAPPRGEP